MTITPFFTRIRLLEPKLHGMAVGMTLGIGSVMLGQNCPLIGQCATCAACLPRLPLLALPLLTDGLLTLSARVLARPPTSPE